MQFTLTFDGQLKSGNSAGAQQKHAMRRHFHKQMKRVWHTHPVLRDWHVSNEEFARRSGNTLPASTRPPIPEDQRPLWVDMLASSFVGENGYRFVPLVRPELHLACSVEIDLLVNKQKTFADLDNIQKTLFDALKMPHAANDKSFFASPPTDMEDPFFCLLQDDRLVTHIQHRVDDLLCPLDGVGYKNAEARCTLRVSLNPTMLTDDNVRFFDGNSSAFDGPPPSIIAGTENITTLSNAQVRLRVAQLTARMRALEVELDRAERISRDQYWRRKEAATNDDDRRKTWAASSASSEEAHQYKDARWRIEILPEAKAVAREIERRLGADLSQISELRAIERGTLAGTAPLSNAAAELESFARQLPSDPAVGSNEDH